MGKSFGESILAAVQMATEAVEQMVDSAVGTSQQAELDREFTLDGSLIFRLKQKSGTVRIVGGAESRVSLHARVTLRTGAVEAAEHYAAALGEAIRLEGNVLDIEPPALGTGFAPARIDWTVEVPTACEVRLRLGNGSVHVADVAGPIDAEAANGEIEVSAIVASVRAQTANGCIGLERCGAVKAESQNGAITITDVDGDVEASSANGTIDVKQASGRITLRTVNGTVTLDSAVHGDVDIETTNGSIDVRVPADSRFELDADVKVGRAETHLPLRDRTELDDAPAAGQLPRVRLRSVIGSITLDELPPAA